MATCRALLVLGCIFSLSICIAQEIKTNPYLPKPRGEAWLDLMTGKIHLAGEAVKPSGPILWGNYRKQIFEPMVADILHAAGEPDPIFVPGWIDLKTGRIQREEMGSPTGIFLRGRIDPKGYFRVFPAELKKWAQPKTVSIQAPIAVPVLPILATRETGFTVDLDQWWIRYGPGRTITNDPVAGWLHLFWLDEDGNICRGDPGVSGRPGAEWIIRTRYSEIDRFVDRSIDEAQLATLRRDTYSLDRYSAQGPHLAQWRAEYTRNRSTGIVSLISGALYYSMPVEITLGPSSVSPSVLRPAFDPDCPLNSVLGLPLPGDVTTSSGQHPTKCLRRSYVPADRLIQSCREGRLTGGVNAGFYRGTD
jgi:hypothetical protein